MDGGTPVVQNARTGAPPTTNSGFVRYIVLNNPPPGFTTSWQVLQVVNGAEKKVGLKQNVPGKFAMNCGGYNIGFNVTGPNKEPSKAHVKVFPNANDERRDTAFVYITYR